MSSDYKHLSLPAVARAHYARNFINKVVCELRFPTLFELENRVPPTALAQALRKDYPVHEYAKDIQTIGPAGVASVGAAHFFRGRNTWTIQMRSAAVSLETDRYESFHQFEERAAAMVKAMAPVIDADFFTRVGLRYINVLPYDPAKVGGWVNPQIVGPLAEGIYGAPSEHSGRVNGTTEDGGGFTMSHGIGLDAKTGRQGYLLDFDFYREDVSLRDTIPVLRQLHEKEFALFSWAIGDEARKHLGPSDYKGE